jgi:hypothetical protein
MLIITRFLYKIKQFYNSYLVEVGVSVLIILVSISSYYLGRYSNIDQTPGTAKIEFKTSIDSSPRVESANTEAKAPEGQVVASKTGKRYYLPWCASAQRISDKNKVFFASALEAERAGLTKASNCKGM